jgi:hypothetical protein
MCCGQPPQHGPHSELEEKPCPAASPRLALQTLLEGRSRLAAGALPAARAPCVQPGSIAVSDGPARAAQTDGIESKHDEVQVLREQSEQQARQLQAAADAVAKARDLTSPRHASAL